MHCTGKGRGKSAADRNRLYKLIKKARSVLGSPLDTVEVVREGGGG